MQRVLHHPELSARARPRVWLWIGLAAVLSAAFTLNVLAGPFGWPNAYVLITFRLPQAMLAMLAGATLAMAGCAYQAAFRNPLAEPYTLGVAAGASLGAVAAIFLNSLTSDPAQRPGWFTLDAYAGALVGGLAITAVVLSLSRVLLNAPAALLLAGVALSYICSAAILLIQVYMSIHDTGRVIAWTIGSVSAVIADGRVLATAPFAGIGGVLLWLRRRELDLLLLGDLVASSRGLNVPFERRRIALIAGVMTAGIVAACGPLAFIGLIVPHVMRPLTASRHVALIPASALAGGAFLLAMDAATRLANVTLPVGVLCHFLGGLFFLGLLLARRVRIG